MSRNLWQGEWERQGGRGSGGECVVHGLDDPRMKEWAIALFSAVD
ncbi:MAG: hypothetical protein AAGD25_09235 [Cyanobacteria bacterium P01_F01_bin.150]